MIDQVVRYYRRWLVSSDFKKYLSFFLIYLSIQVGLFLLIRNNISDFSNPWDSLFSIEYWLAVVLFFLFGAACVVVAKCSPRFGGYIVFITINGLLFRLLLPYKGLTFSEVLTFSFCMGLYLDRGYSIHRAIDHVYSGMFGGWIIGIIVSGIVSGTNVLDIGIRLAAGGFLFMIISSTGAFLMISFLKSYSSVKVEVRASEAKEA